MWGRRSVVGSGGGGVTGNRGKNYGDNEQGVLSLFDLSHLRLDFRV